MKKYIFTSLLVAMAALVNVAAQNYDDVYYNPSTSGNSNTNTTYDNNNNSQQTADGGYANNSMPSAMAAKLRGKRWV